MFDQILVSLIGISKLKIQDYINVGSFSLYLLISPKWNLWNLTKYFIEMWANINVRRLVMKHLQFNLLVLLAVFTLPVFSGCYTSFRTLRQHSPSDLHSQDAAYYDDEQYYEGTYYDDEDLYYQEDTELQFQPSRFMVTKTYYSYGDYIKSERYIVHDPYPWLNPYYYDYPYARWHFNIYYSFHPWYVGGYYGGYYPVIYSPGYAYPWFDWLICYPGPVYYPYPVFYPYPVYYHAPYYDHADRKPHKKREWDRWQPKRNRGIATRRRPGSSGNTGNSRNSKIRGDRTPEGTRISGTRGSKRTIAVRERDNGKIRRTRNTDRSDLTQTKRRNTGVVSPRIASRSRESSREIRKSNSAGNNKQKRNIRPRQNRVDQTPRSVAQPSPNIRKKSESRTNSRSYQTQRQENSRNSSRPKQRVTRQKSRSQNSSRQITKSSNTSKPAKSRISRSSQSSSRNSKKESTKQNENKSRNRSSSRKRR